MTSTPTPTAMTSMPTPTAMTSMPTPMAMTSMPTPTAITNMSYTKWFMATSLAPEIESSRIAERRHDQ